jgi:hypothetical protein
MFKRLDVWDVALIKWSVFAFALFLVAVWPAFTKWVVSVNPWYFLILFILFMARPFYRGWLKK